MTMAIIGAGMAGLACASALRAAGQAVTVFDKGRGPGGRMSTRRAATDLGEVRFDHGAQYFTAPEAEFAATVDAWVTAGVAAPWQGRFVTFEGGEGPRPLPDTPRYVGVPSMNAIIRHMASGLDVSWGRRVSGISGRPGKWTLAFEDGAEAGPFSHIVSAVPAEQAGPLLDPVAPALANTARSVVSDPSWTVMAAFDAPLRAGFDGAVSPSPAIGWAARNASKPGRGAGESWVLQATPDWSRAHLEDEADAVARALLADFAVHTGGMAPVHLAAHRWRYAQVSSPSGAVAEFDRDLHLGSCGDWHHGPSVRDAWKSGHALAEMMIDPNS